MKKIGLILLILIAASCAKIGMPEGGPKDNTPPKAIRSKPENNSTNFNGKEIEIVFDEYIELKNLRDELMISPPLSSNPKISSRLNKLKISWEEDLRENTTYIFDLGDAIVDHNEGNALKGYVFSFSTGDNIDTFFYESKVVDAYSLEPIIKKTAMLYNAEDSIDISVDKPNYITRTDSSGNFRFKNIREGSYKVVIIDDKNQNLLYDPKLESIGFLDHSIIARNHGKDTIIEEKVIYFNTLKEEVKEIKSKTITTRHRLDLVFTFPLDSGLFIEFKTPKLSGLDDENLYYSISKGRDSLSLFALKHSFDSLEIKVGDSGFAEDIRLRYKEKKTEKTDSISKHEDDKRFKIKKPKKEHPHYMDLLLEMPYPIFDSNSYEIVSINKKDSLATPVLIYIYKEDPLYLRVDQDLEEGREYEYIIEEGTFENLLGEKNDSLVFSIKTTSSREFGSFSINIKDSIESSIILELEDSKKKIIRRERGSIGEGFEFNYLSKGRYRLRLIYDENNNGNWDMGDYENGILPEKVIYYPKSINIIENWDIEENWELSKASGE